MAVQLYVSVIRPKPLMHICKVPLPTIASERVTAAQTRCPKTSIVGQKCVTCKSFLTLTFIRLIAFAFISSVCFSSILSVGFFKKATMNAACVTVQLLLLLFAFSSVGYLFHAVLAQPHKYTNAHSHRFYTRART